MTKKSWRTKYKNMRRSKRAADLRMAGMAERHAALLAERNRYHSTLFYIAYAHPEDAQRAAEAALTELPDQGEPRG